MNWDDFKDVASFAKYELTRSDKADIQFVAIVGWATLVIMIVIALAITIMG